MKTNLIVLLLASVALPAFAAPPEGDKPKARLEWRDFPEDRFPVPPQDTPHPRSKRMAEAFAKRMDKKRAPYVKKLVGREFRDLGKIVSIEPSETHRGKFDVIATAMLLPGRPWGYQPHHSGNLVHRRAAWLATAAEASRLAVGMETKVEGEIADVSIVDWQNAMSEGDAEIGLADYDAADFIFTIHLSDSEAY